MQVIETFTCGKSNRADLNEDAFVVTNDYIAVIDGATSKLCPLIQGKTGARFAADVLSDAVRQLPPDLTAREGFDQLSQILKTTVEATIKLPPEADPPTAAIILYSKKRREIWRVGDSGIMIDGVFHTGDKLIDNITYAARAFYLETAVAMGTPVEELLKDDIGRTYIQAMLNNQHVFANREGAYGYSVMDGKHIPDSMIEVISVQGAGEVALASDGYPRMFMTLAECESYLADVLRDDPLMFRRHKSAKGLSPGWVSFDDRTYVRFKP